MKKLLLILAATLGLAYLILPIIRPPGGESVLGQDLPWQITPTGDGSITVFGLTLGDSTLQDAVAKLGRRYELGLFVAPDGQINLEAYFRDTVLGGINAKIVVTAGLEQEILQNLLKAAASGERLPGDARKYPVSEADIPTALSAPIAFLTYAPYPELDDKLVLKRFGEPAERIAMDDNVHWLYPEQGLDLVLNRDGKAILQYLPPRDFERIRMPLIQTKRTE